MKPTPYIPRAPVATRFRNEIEKAEGDGVARTDMTLSLTQKDVSELKRDRSVPLADISFAGGTMTYIGVSVVQGGVTTSILTSGELAQEPPAPAEEPKPKPKPKRQARSASRTTASV